MARAVTDCWDPRMRRALATAARCSCWPSLALTGCGGDDGGREGHGTTSGSVGVPGLHRPAHRPAHRPVELPGLGAPHRDPERDPTEIPSDLASCLPTDLPTDLPTAAHRRHRRPTSRPRPPAGALDACAVVTPALISGRPRCRRRPGRRSARRPASATPTPRTATTSAATPRWSSRRPPGPTGHAGQHGHPTRGCPARSRSRARIAAGPTFPASGPGLDHVRR